MNTSINIFITGANGSLGAELIERLIGASGIKITALAKDNNDTCNLAKFDGLKIIYGDICEPPDNILQELTGTDVLIHFAALVHLQKSAKQLYYKINFEATRSLCEAFAQRSKSSLKQFIFSSTVSVYGNNLPFECTEDSLCQPETPYAQSKFLAETAIKECAADSRLNYTILRPATVYGDLDKGNIPRLIRLLNKYHFFLLFNGGRNRKSFVYVGDVTKAIAQCINNPQAFNETFILSAPPVSISELITEISRVFNIKVTCLDFPLSIFALFPIVKKLTQNNLYSFGKAQNILGFSPLPLSEGLRRLDQLAILGRVSIANEK